MLFYRLLHTIHKAILKYSIFYSAFDAGFSGLFIMASVAIILTILGPYSAMDIIYYMAVTMCYYPSPGFARFVKNIFGFQFGSKVCEFCKMWKKFVIFFNVILVSVAEVKPHW